MPYGIIKIDTITFTDAGVDKSVAISGLVQNPTFTGNVTATGTISGLIVQAPTVTGTTANFASGVYTTQISGAIVKVPAGSAGAPSIQVGVGASVAPGLYGAGIDLLGISTGGAGRIFIDSTGQLGIGTSSPSQALEVAGNISVTANAASARIFGPPLSSDTTLVLRGGSSTGEGANIELGRDEIVYIDATQHLFRSLAGTERARIDNSGRLLVGTSSNRPSRIGTSSFNSLLQIESDTEAAQSITRWAADSNSSRLHLQKGRGTGASPTIVAADDNLGDFTFSGYDGANMTNGARITAAVDGTPGTNDMPGRLVFSTTADGAASPTERMRITSGGYFKASNDGNYFGLTGAYHETYQTADEPTLVARATNATLTNALHYAVASRAANSAYFFFVGTSGYGGTADDEFKLYGDGNGKCDGAWTGGGADYAEYFEWSDGNFSAEDRRGISVVLNGGKIQPALVGEDPIGVISGNPSVVGDAAWNKWSGKYLRDEYGTYIQEDYEVEDEDGNAVIQQRRKLNPAYDPNQEYVSREERPEWDCVGLMGKLRIRKGQPTGSRWIKMRDISNSVEEWLVR
jgi:hypothetical protein